MSNRPLVSMMRGGMRDFHVGAGRTDRTDRTDRDTGLVRFGGERHDRVAAHYTFSVHTKQEDKHDYSKKENRETKSKKRSKMGKEDGGSTTGDNSSSDEEGKKKKTTRSYKKGEDADKDKTGSKIGPE